MFTSVPFETTLFSTLHDHAIRCNVLIVPTAGHIFTIINARWLESEMCNRLKVILLECDEIDSERLRIFIADVLDTQTPIYSSFLSRTKHLRAL